MDKLYKMWEDRNEASISSSNSDTKDWMSYLDVFTSISTLREEAVELIKANVDTVMSVSITSFFFVFLHEQCLIVLYIDP